MQWGDEFSHHRSLSVTTTENARPEHDGTNTQEKRRDREESEWAEWSGYLRSQEETHRQGRLSSWVLCCLLRILRSADLVR